MKTYAENQWNKPSTWPVYMSHTLSMVEGKDIYEPFTLLYPHRHYRNSLPQRFIDLKTKNKCINAGLIIAILRNWWRECQKTRRGYSDSTWEVLTGEIILQMFISQAWGGMSWRGEECVAEYHVTLSKPCQALTATNCNNKPLSIPFFFFSFETESIMKGRYTVPFYM